MKTKLVLWGSDAEDAKVLLALQLRAEDNMVDVYAFHGEYANNDIHRRLLYEWREGKEMAFPETGYTRHETALTVAEGLLPEGIKAERGDLVQRAQTEWHFVVLSSKLSAAYEEELRTIKERINQLTSFDQGLWEELKGFWNKVQEQMREHNLGRDHGDLLREETNKGFAKLKELRSALDAVFKDKAQSIFEKFTAIMDGFDVRLRDGASLSLLFDELKDIQKEFRSAKLTRDLRTKMWERIDGTFKKVKEKRFGEGASSHSPLERIQRRYEGLLGAIKRMDNSIKKDEDELNFQLKKINSYGTNQLESQLREAKVKMIKERIRSKKEKLSDMHVTKAQLEGQIEKEKAKEEALAAKKEEAAKRKEAAAKKAAEAKKAKDEAAAKAKEVAEAKEKTAPSLEAAAPVVEAAKAAAPAEDTPVVEKPTVDEPAIEEAPVEEPTVEEPTVVEMPAEDVKEETPEIIDEAAAKLEATGVVEAEVKAADEATPEVLDEAAIKEDTVNAADEEQ